MIHLKEAHIGYSQALISVEDLMLERGQLYILAGKNGAGKSTLLRTLTGQLPALRGEILLDGKPLGHFNEQSISRQIAFVGSTFPSVDFLRTEEYIALGRTPYTNAFGRLHPKDTEALERAIRVLNIAHLRNKFTSQLSDGERQMAAIARAVTQETDAILLDEPTAFLDYTNKTRILHLLKKIAEEQHKCIILSSHDIDISLTAQCPFLVVENATCRLLHLPPPIDKQTVIRSAFPEAEA